MCHRCAGGEGRARGLVGEGGSNINAQYLKCFTATSVYELAYGRMPNLYLRARKIKWRNSASSL